MKYLLLILLGFEFFSAYPQQTIVLQEAGIENAYPRLSMDGKEMLYQSNRSGKWQLYVQSLDGKKQRQLTNGNYNNNLPDWSCDNKWIAFVSDRDGNEEIYIMHSDGSDPERITNDPGRDIHPYFSPDGKKLLFSSDRDKQFDIYSYDVEKKLFERLTNTPEDETCARYSPDMKHIVYLKNNDATDDVFILDLSTFLSDNISKTSQVYHGWPMYSHDGKWIYYSSMEGGTYSIFRIKPDGTGKQQLTNAKAGEENARVNVADNNRFMIYNIKSGKTIYIVREALNE